MNRAEAIETLKAKGLHVRERTWSLGHSIFAGALPFDHGEISGHRVGLYLYPDPNDAIVWWVTNFAVPSPDTKCASLAEAVEIASQRVIAEARRIESEEA